MTTLHKKRIALYMALAFGLSWVIALVIYLTGGLIDSPAIAPGVTPALLLLLVYMWMPATANILTRWLTGEGKQTLYLRPYLKREWRYWLLAWLGPVILTALGAAVYFLIFPARFDPSFSLFREQLAATEAQTGQEFPLPVGAIFALQFVSALFFGPLVNALFTFGEEFGWRAYLQPKLLPLGARKMYLLMGVIWGVWHWPIIAMGHNYGLDYPGYPWLGLLAMVWFTFVVGAFLGWATLRAGSVWPAVIGHASVNASAGLGFLFLAEETSQLVGPLPVGIIGSAAWSAVALWIFWRVGRKPAETVPLSSPAVEG